MAYVLISIASVLFSFQFFFQNVYKRKFGSGISASILFLAYAAVAGAIILTVVNLILNGVALRFSWFSLGLAAIWAIAEITFIIVSAKSLDTANLAVFSTFTMLGGMSLPFIFGITVKNEGLGVFKILGFLIIVAAFVISAIEDKSSDENLSEDEKKILKRKKIKAIFYYVAVFILNGSFGVISSIHQLEAFSTIASDGYSFMILEKICALLFCVILILIFKFKVEKPEVKIIASTACYSACNGIGNLLVIIALLTLPSSVQYPIVTGGTIILSAVISSVMEKRVSIKSVIAAALSLLATLLLII